MQIVRPNYNDCLTNLSNSILKYFGCETINPTLPDIDEILKENNSKNVLVILFDGMGSNILERNLSENSFLRKHVLRNLHSVFPPTTTAATTSLLSGLHPSQHGWLGWDLYFKKENKIVTMFRNTIKDTDNKIKGDIPLAHKYYGYTPISKKILEKYEAYEILPFGPNPYINLNDMSNQIINLCKKTGKKLIYAYCEEPDSSSHLYGADSRDVKSIYKTINSKVESLVEKLEDTTVIIIADHGHITSESITLSNYPDVFNTLKKDISIEGRACNFFIKTGMKDLFEDLFAKYFENDFILYSKKQVLEKHVFGIGK